MEHGEVGCVGCWEEEEEEGVEGLVEGGSHCWWCGVVGWVEKKRGDRVPEEGIGSAYIYRHGI